MSIHRSWLRDGSVLFATVYQSYVCNLQWVLLGSEYHYVVKSATHSLRLCTPLLNEVTSKLEGLATSKKKRTSF